MITSGHDCLGMGVMFAMILREEERVCITDYQGNPIRAVFIGVALRRCVSPVSCDLSARRVRHIRFTCIILSFPP